MCIAGRDVSKRNWYNRPSSLSLLLFRDSNSIDTDLQENVSLIIMQRMSYDMGWETLTSVIYDRECLLSIPLSFVTSSMTLYAVAPNNHAEHWRIQDLR